MGHHFLGTASIVVMNGKPLVGPSNCDRNINQSEFIRDSESDSKLGIALSSYCWIIDSAQEFRFEVYISCTKPILTKLIPWVEFGVHVCVTF